MQDVFGIWGVLLMCFSDFGWFLLFVRVVFFLASFPVGIIMIRRRCSFMLLVSSKCLLLCLSGGL